MAGGDREALGELYDTHADALFGHAMALTRRRDQAEDLVQDVFVSVAGLGPALLSIRRPGAYLHQMLRLAFIDGERHSAVVAATAELGPADPGPAADDGISETDRVAVERAIQALPVGQREVVLLHIIEGLTFREVATLTGTAMWTVASRYRLGINRLRALLGVEK